VKAELIGTVLKQIEKWLGAVEVTEATRGKAEAAREQLTKVTQLARTITIKASPAVGTAAAPLVGLPPAAGTAIGAAAGAAVEHGFPARTSDQQADVEEKDDPVEFASASEFHVELKRLMADIEGLKGLVVLIDDLDRCNPDTIIETFETIRLFLHVPNTAYVIAAHPAIVEAAVAHRYAGNRDGDSNLGRDYLEKIIHLPIVVPPLSQPEVETYINLLYAQLLLDAPKFEELREAAKQRRAREPLGVAMNYGIANDVLDVVPKELQDAFQLANRIGPILGQGLRGNPRQVKRFLNGLRLRLLTAARREVDLDAAVLAKLMVLELDRDDFQALFEWQIAQDGTPIELRHAEALVRDQGVPDGMNDAVKAWSAKPSVRRWLSLEPPLGDIPLGRYFFFARDRLSPVASAARLTGELQDLLAKLQVQAKAQRTGAVKAAVALGEVDRAALYDALVERAAREPRGAAMDSALDIAQQSRGMVAAFGAALRSIAPSAVPVGLPPKLKLAFNDGVPPEVDAALDDWATDGPARLKKSVAEARS
jgi:hypothetical protein